MADPYTVEFRVYNPESGQVAFIVQSGRNELHCHAIVAGRFPGFVVTRGEDQVFAGEPGQHLFNADGSVCVNCGGYEWLLPDGECSGIYGLE